MIQITSRIKTAVAGGLLLVAILVSAYVSWALTSNSYQGDIAALKKEHADQVAQYERDIGAIKAKAQEETAAAITRMKAAQDALAILDQQKSQELANAQAENDALKRDVADGTRRVRILQANLSSGCSANSNASGGNTGTGSVGNGTAVELTAEAGRTVLDLRQDIIRDQAKLTYLQGYVRDVVKQCKRL